MFELIFGLIWTTISTVIAFAFYGSTGGTIYVNGVPTSQEEFNAMLFPKIFIGVFILIGLFFLYRGLKKVVTNIITTAQGEVKYGYIAETHFNGSSVNGRPRYNANILVLVEGVVQTFEEDIGFKHFEFPAGAYVKVKHHKNDVNILEVVNDYEAPIRLKEYVEKNICSNPQGNAPDTIIVDGVEYVRKDSMLTN